MTNTIVINDLLANEGETKKHVEKVLTEELDVDAMYIDIDLTLKKILIQTKLLRIATGKSLLMV